MSENLRADLILGGVVIFMFLIGAYIGYGMGETRALKIVRAEGCSCLSASPEDLAGERVEIKANERVIIIEFPKEKEE